MKKNIFTKTIIIGFVISLLSVCYCEDNVIELIKYRSSKAVIAIPVIADKNSGESYWTNKAATWLQYYLHLSTGAKIPIVEENDKLPETVISVGHTNLAQKAGFDLNKEKWNTAIVAVKNKNLFLIGHDEYIPIRRSYIGAKGTCKAVAIFLEHVVGVRWYMPTPEGVKIPHHDEINISENYYYKFTPIFAYISGRQLYPYRGNDGLAAFANNNVCSVKMKTYGGHSWNVWVSEKEYFKDHPEYFRLDEKGKRNPFRNHLCTSNKDVRDILLREIRKVFDEGYDLVQLGQSDGWSPCLCENCQRLDNLISRRECAKKGINYYEHLKKFPAERVNLLHKYIIDECAKSHPNKKVHLLVYGPTIWPSKKFDRYGDNVIAEVCHFYDVTLPVWGKKVAGQTVYLYWFGWYNSLGIASKMSPMQIAKNLRFFRDNKVMGIYLCGANASFGLEGPNYYAMSKLVENPNDNPQSYIDEFCNYIYGNAGEDMKKFYALLYKTSALYPEMKKTPWELGATRNPDDTPAVAFPKVYPEEVLKQFEVFLSAAEKSADNEKSKGFIRVVRDSFDYVKYTSKMFELYNLVRKGDKLPRETFVALKDVIANWNTQRDKIMNYKDKEKDYIKKYFAGYYQTRNYLEAKGRLRGIITEPTEWNLDVLLDEKKTLSEADDVEKIVYNEDFEDDKEWPGTKNNPELISEISPNGYSGKCLHIKGKTNSRYFTYSNRIIFEGGGRFRITIRVKADVLTPKNKDYYFRTGAHCEKSRYIVVKSQPYLMSYSGWQELSIEVDIPKDFKKMHLYFQCGDRQKNLEKTCDLYIDSVRVSKLKAK